MVEIVMLLIVLDKSLDGIHNISIRILPDAAKGEPIMLCSTLRIML